MSKSDVTELLRVYRSIFQDAEYAYPALGGEFEKDFTRLTRLVERNGVRIFYVDLPAAGKCLDQALSSGQYKLSQLPLTGRVSKRVQMPKFLRELYLLVFSESGVLKEDCDVQAIYFLRQILFAAKKVSQRCDETAVLAEVEDFVSTDSQLPIPDSFWNKESPTADDASVFGGFSKSTYYRSKVEALPSEEARQVSTFLRILDVVSSTLATTLGHYAWSEWKFRHGPGAVSDHRSGSNKFSWRNWSQRLENVFPLADCGFHNYASWAGAASVTKIGSHEPVSRLIDVPKTYTKPRLIAAEPSEHMWCQQNIWHYFRVRSKETWISEFVRFNDQSLNQQLCLRGSQDGSLATVDLSAASDRVTCHAVGQLFRGNPNLLVALQSCRTRFIEISQGDEPRVLELRKFSTMGSACTFPVESLMFLSVAISSVLTKRQLKPTVRNIRSLAGSVAVFGDDIVIPEDCREVLFRGLEVLDFKVNVHKSFWIGKFRESCGVDAFAGVAITPAYLRTLEITGPESVAGVAETSNNFYQRLLVHTANTLASTIQEVKLPLVPMDSAASGLNSFVRPGAHRLKKRYNQALQVHEYEVPQLITKVRRTEATDDTGLLQFFTEEPEPHLPWKAGTNQRPAIRIDRVWVDERHLCFKQE